MSTEAADPRYRDIALWPTARAVAAMLEGQLAAAAALLCRTDAIAAAADAVADRLRRGDGRLVLAGAGTSGRIAVQDGVELTPTFGWPERRLLFLLAGGDAAMTRSVEGAEDDSAAATDAVAAHAIGPADVVVGVAASGRTPYTLAIVDAARRRGALTVGIANNAATPLLDAADHAILADTGSEVVAGSTRMKAGTAQKAALNTLSTAAMIRLGHVYDGMMVDMRVSNAKLDRRACRMVALLAGVDDARAADALAATGAAIKPAVLVARGAVLQDALARLHAAGGDLHRLDRAPAPAPAVTGASIET